MHHSTKRFGINLTSPITKCIVAVFLTFTMAIEARHLDGRTGVGITLHDFEYTPSVSLRFHLSNYQSVTVLSGFNTEASKHNLVIGGKLHQNIFLEEGMNFYASVGAFLITGKLGQPTTSGGVEISGCMGGEFFLHNLPNLGFSFETGVAIRTIRQVSFVTLGNGFIGSAVHYYF